MLDAKNQNSVYQWTTVYVNKILWLSVQLRADIQLTSYKKIIPAFIVVKDPDH